MEHHFNYLSMDKQSYINFSKRTKLKGYKGVSYRLSSMVY